MPTLLEHLKQRKIGQWGLAYLAFLVAVLGVQDAVADPLQLSDAFQRAVLVLLVFGLPLVLVLAWFHGDQGGQRVRGSELLMIALIIGGAGASLALLPSEAESPRRGALTAREGLSIAVLPFRYLGPDPGIEHFADAMTNELTLRLARIEGVRVRSPRSMARFKGSELDVTEIANELGVSHVLEGAVQWGGEQARFTVQFTDASTGFGEWSQAFSGASPDPFTLTGEMAVRVADALDLYLSPTETDAVRTRYTDNAEAWNAFHQGWVFVETAHAEGDYSEARLGRAEEYFARALHLDSLYAPALAGMSLTHGYVYYAGLDDSPERLATAEAMALKALEIDDQLPEAHTALGQVRAIQGDHLAAAEAYEGSLELDDDNAMAWCLLAWVCNRLDPQDAIRAERAARESISRDPAWFMAYHQLGWALQGQGRYEEAEVALKDGIAVNNEYPYAYEVLGEVQLSLGKYDDALVTLERAVSLDEGTILLLNLGAAQALTGDLDGALESIERALTRGFRAFDAFSGSPYFEALRDDPRLEALLDEYRAAP